MKKILVVLFLCTYIFFSDAKAQLLIDSIKTNSELVNDVLLGGGVSISNISYTGSPKAIGGFSGTSNIGIGKGIILSTGRVSYAKGPNNIAQDGTASNFGLPGDKDLNDLLTNGMKTEDAAVLEFDFIPVSDTIRFNYVFASEEYLGANCSIFNDIFSFMLTGPNPKGGNYINTNIALIPGTSTPVAINSVNSGIISPHSDTSYCDALDPNWRNYSKYFNDNGNGTSAYPQYYDSKIVQYNGFTDVFTASAAIVPCKRYHIKLAIADVGDGWNASAVFLEAKSFSGGLKVITDQNSADNNIIEGCKRSNLNFIRFAKFDSTITIDYQLTGSAQKNTDYIDESGNSFGGKITFNKLTPPFPASDTVTLNFKAPFDGLHENAEHFEFKIINSLGCKVDTVKIDYTIINSDSLDYSINGKQDVCRGDTIAFLPVLNNGHYPFHYSWNAGQSTDSVFTNFLNASDTVRLAISDACKIPGKNAFLPVSLHYPAKNNWINDTNCANLNIIFSNQSQIGISDGYIADFLWNIEGKEASGTQVGHHFSSPGVYNVALMTHTNYGCRDIVKKEIEIIDCDLYASSVITANNDGFNDYLFLHDLSHSEWSLQVYNRWGLKVYSSNNYHNEWKPENLTHGVYYYVFEKLGTSFSFEGYFQLLE